MIRPLTVALIGALLLTAGGCSSVRYANTVATVPKLPAVPLPEAKTFSVSIAPATFDTEPTRQAIAIPGFERAAAADADLAITVTVGAERLLTKDYIEHRPDKGPQGFLGTYRVRRDFTVVATPKRGEAKTDQRYHVLEWREGSFDGPLYAMPILVDAAYDEHATRRIVTHVNAILRDAGARLADTYGRGSEQIQVSLAGVEKEPRFQQVQLAALDLINRCTADQRPAASEWQPVVAVWTDIKQGSTVPEAPGAAAYDLAMVRYVQGDYDGAVAEMQDAVRLNPNEERARNVLQVLNEKARRAKNAP